MALRTNIAARAAVVEVSLRVDALSSAQYLSGRAASSSDGRAGSAGTRLIAGASDATRSAVSGIAREQSANATARCAQARVGVALRLHLVFDQHVGIGTQGCRAGGDAGAQ